MIIAVIILAMLMAVLSIMLLLRANMLDKMNYDLMKELGETKRLRRQEVHNNTILLNKNRELIKTISKAHNIVFSNKTLPGKEDELKELLSFVK